MSVGGSQPIAAGALKTSLPVALLAVALGAAEAGAQSGRHGYPVVDSGTVVRVELSASPTLEPWPPVAYRVRGVVHAVEPDTLFLVQTGHDGIVAIPRLQIRRVTRSQTVSRRASALQAGLASAVVAVLVLVEWEDARHSFGSKWRAGAAGATAGMTGGALVGALRPNERWQPARLPE